MERLEPVSPEPHSENTSGMRWGHLALSGGRARPCGRWAPSLRHQEASWALPSCCFSGSHFLSPQAVELLRFSCVQLFQQNNCLHFITIKSTPFELAGEFSEALLSWRGHLLPGLLQLLLPPRVLSPAASRLPASATSLPLPSPICPLLCRRSTWNPVPEPHAAASLHSACPQEPSL